MFDEKIFKNHLFDFLKDSLVICNSNSEKLLSNEIKWPEFFSNGKYKKFNVKTIPDYAFFIRRSLKNEIINLKSFETITKFLVIKRFKEFNKKLMGEVHYEFEKEPNFVSEFPLNFLVDYLGGVGSFIVNKSFFNKSFKRFFKFFEELLVDEYVTPLFNFNSDIDQKPIMIEDVGIRKINEQEFSRFSDLDNVMELPNIYHSLTHVMFIRSPSKDLNSGYEYVKKQFHLLLESLSLFSTGNPHFGTIYRNINSPWIHHDSRYDQNVIHQKSLQFNKKDKRKVGSILKTIKSVDYSVKGNKFVEISKNRYISALSRINGIDKLIDLAISVECLYVSGPGEITVKLVNRASTLLAKNDKEREDYWYFIKKVYSLRSGIVHGDELRSTEINGKQYEIDEIIDKLITLTQKSIIMYSKLIHHYDGKKKIEKIYDDIDIGLINRSLLKEIHSKCK